MKEKFLNLPNTITSLRILASLGLFTFVALSGITVSIPLAITTGVVGLTDALDGYLARKNKSETKLGKILDPIADKVYNWGLAFTLMAMGAMPLWPALIAARDIAVAGTYYHLKVNKKKENLRPTKFAKLKMGLQSIGLVSSLAFGFGTSGLSLIAPIAMGGALATALPEAKEIKKKYFSDKKEDKEEVKLSPPIEEIKESQNTKTLSYPKTMNVSKDKTKVKVKKLER